MPKVPKAKKKRSKRTVIIVSAVVVVLAAAGGGAYWWFAAHKPQTPEEKVSTGLSQSEDAYNKGDYTGALIAVSDLDKQAATDEQKAEIYQAAAQAANASGDLEKAAQYYEKKHEADSSSSGADAYSLGVIYQRLGQNDKALEQFKIALDYANSSKKSYGSDAPAIQAAIDELEAN